MFVLGMQVTRMGLFGLGLPEVVVIAGVAALLFGERCAYLSHNLGKFVIRK